MNLFRKIVLFAAGALISAATQAQFTPGNILTASQLNTALAAPTITGGTINGAAIGATAPSTAIFSSTGIGVSPAAVPLDVRTAGAVGAALTNSTLARFYAGSSSIPITAITPSVAISRYEAINQDTQGGQNAALLVEDVGTNSSSGGTIAQVTGITSVAVQAGTGDSSGLVSTSMNASTTAGYTAFGGYFQANATTSGTRAFGVEIDSANNTGSDVSYSQLSPYPAHVGIHVQAIGSNMGTAGVWVGSLTGTPQYDVGIAFTPGSIKTAAIEDNTSSVNSILVTGSHTNGLNLSGGTFSGSSILAPNFSVSSAGAVAATSAAVSGAIKSSSSSGGVGYATGAGGTITQATSKSTGVTLNRPVGQITTNNAALAAGAVVLFTVTNSTVAVGDVIVIQRASGGTAGAYFMYVDSVANGSFVVSLQNGSGGSLSEAVTLSFAVLKGVTS